MSKPFTLIALCGLAGSGKDTVADLLVTHCGFIKIAFADSLYNEVSDAFGIDAAQLRQRETKEHPLTALALRKCEDDAFTGRIMRWHLDQGLVFDIDAPRSPRQILQWWGTEYRRHQSQAYWVSKASARISYYMGERLATKFVLTDCRFHNEEHMVRNGFGGMVWQVKRPGLPDVEGGHASASDGDAFKPSVVLHNDHDIRHLQQLVLGEYWAHDAGLAGVKVEITA
jgi:hypothetical protein